MSLTLAEAAERTGKSQTILRKHIERGKLRASKDGARVLIDQSDLDAYMASDLFEEAAVHASAGSGVEVGNVIARLPSKFTSAILEGMGIGGTKSRAPSPKPWTDATAGLPVSEVGPETSDPNHGFKVGHVHVDGPQWAHVKDSVWRLDDAIYTWNGSAWEGSGSRSGTLEGRISPAHPDAHYRPLGPGRVVR